jgi:hypothetical protein
MAISLFLGLMGGAILGYATQDGRSSICKYLLAHHPNALKAGGVILLLVLILIPSAVLSGVLAVSSTPFFWGGCAACSFVYGFFVTHCQILQGAQAA